MRKSMLLLMILILVVSVPAYGVVKVELDTSGGWANPVTGETTVWETGFRTSGDWGLTEKWAFFLRDELIRNSEIQGWAGVLERCYLRYETGAVRINLGRQAVNWGVGWFFRPTDLITPQNPLTKDDTRPGRDLATLYWGTSPVTGFEAVAGENLAALRNDWRIGATNFRLLAVNQTGNLQFKTIGFDFQGGLAGFYGEGIYLWTDEFSTGKPILMLGWGRTMDRHQLFVEYLKDTSQQIYINEDYLAVGWEFSIDELTSFTLACVSSLKDGGTVLTGSAGFQLGDSMDLNATVNFLIGHDSSEFLMKAGLARTTALLQLKYYF